jgi:hypothetical protein
MIAEPKIAAASWTNLEDGLLDTFSTTASIILSDAALYPQLAAEATALSNASSSYHIAYSRFKQFGGSNNKETKDFAKYALYQAHQAAANKLEATANGDQEYLVRPGYLLDQKGGRSSKARVAAPTLKKAESNSARGRVKFILKAQNPREIKGIIGQYSEDNGTTWSNGLHLYDLNFTLENQPSGKGVLYQFKFRATNNRESEWSERFYVEVY